MMSMGTMKAFTDGSLTTVVGLYAPPVCSVGALYHGLRTCSSVGKEKQLGAFRTTLRSRQGKYYGERFGIRFTLRTNSNVTW